MPVAVLFVIPGRQQDRNYYICDHSFAEAGCQLVAAEPLARTGMAGVFRSFGISTVNHLIKWVANWRSC